LWAEDSTLPLGASPEASAHPFAVSGEALLELLPSGVGKADTVSLVLPSFAATVAASPELARDPLAADPASNGRPWLRAWQVPAVSVEPAPALSLLDEFAESITGCRPGASIHYLGAVVTLALDLVDRGRVLPSLVDGPAARWRPELSGVDSARFTALAVEQRRCLPHLGVRCHRLPPAGCRARRPGDASTRFGRDPVEASATPGRSPRGRE